MGIVAPYAGKCTGCHAPYAGHRTHYGGCRAGTRICVGTIPAVRYLVPVQYAGSIPVEGVRRVARSKRPGARPRFTTPVAGQAYVVITGAPEGFMRRMTRGTGEDVGFRQGNGLRPVKKRQEKS